MKNTQIDREVKAKILVVDDNLVLREFIEVVLLANGYSCMCVEDGLAALELLQSETFDLMISDVEMPRLNGIELLSNVQTAYPAIKIIMISGKYHPDGARHTLSLDKAHHFLSKPFSVNLLLSTIHSVLTSPACNY